MDKCERESIPQWMVPMRRTHAESCIFCCRKALDNYRPLQAKFVRPDTDEAASDLLAAFVSRSSPVSVNERPQFRTALEQVSNA